MYSFISSFVFKGTTISVLIKVPNSIVFTFIICSLSLILIQIGMVKQSLFLSKISLFKSNKLTCFGLSSVLFFLFYLVLNIFSVLNRIHYCNYN